MPRNKSILVPSFGAVSIGLMGFFQAAVSCDRPDIRVSGHSGRQKIGASATRLAGYPIERMLGFPDNRHAGMPRSKER